MQAFDLHLHPQSEQQYFLFLPFRKVAVAISPESSKKETAMPKSESSLRTPPWASV